MNVNKSLMNTIRQDEENATKIVCLIHMKVDEGKREDERHTQNS